MEGAVSVCAADLPLEAFHNTESGQCGITAFAGQPGGLRGV